VTPARGGLTGRQIGRIRAREPVVAAVAGGTVRRAESESPCPRPVPAEILATSAPDPEGEPELATASARRVDPTEGAANDRHYF